MPRSWGDFGYISGALDDMDTNRLRYVDAREWFKKVLYYNSDTMYYCADVMEIAHTLAYFEGKGLDILGTLAIDKYLIDNHKCLSWYYIRNWESTYASAMAVVINTWRDTVKDSLKTPLDTTLPSIDELGLAILRGQNAVISRNTFGNVLINYFSATTNPFITETTLDFTLNRMSYIQLAIYDVLGRLVWGDGDGRGSSLEAGEHAVHIDGKDLPVGILYARISTGFGEVRTVKLVHE